MFSWTKLRTELRFSPFSYSGQCKQKVTGNILTSMSDFGYSVIFRKMWHRQHQGSVRAVSRSLQLIFNLFPEIDLRAMGFNANWEQAPFGDKASLR